MENHKRAELELPQIVLASGSPRRADLLKAVGWKFRKIVADIDESEHEGEDPIAYVTRLAVEKSKAVAAIESGSIVLGADTTVVVDDSIVGKPVDAADATRMIEMLSGRWHDVLTGVALTTNGSTTSGVQRTSVRFAQMSSEEIAFLVRYGNPLDKAGAYAIQAQAALFIEEIKGDYWNVTGLPVNLVYRLFRSLVQDEA